MKLFLRAAVLGAAALPLGSIDSGPTHKGSGVSIIMGAGGPARLRHRLAERIEALNYRISGGG
jgi:hypothetical protein